MNFLNRALQLVSLFIVCILGVVSGCSLPNKEGFAIYLTRGDISPWEMPSSLNRIDIPAEPLVGMEDIITYDFKMHQITLSENASKRVSALKIPTDGTSFVVCVNRKPVYWGTLWPLYSSGIPPKSCVIVSYPLSHTVQLSDTEGFQMSPDILELNYYSENDDPRNDTRILESLKQGGKLTTNL
jgi:hypothetical protein